MVNEVTIEITRPGQTPDQKEVVTLSSQGARTDFDSWDGFVIGAGSSMAQDLDLSLEIDDLTVRRTAEE